VKGLETFLAELRGLGVRLWVEGDKLRLRAPEGVLSRELTDILKERKAEILDFCRPDLINPIPPVASQESYELSAAQRRLWVLAQFPEGSAAYNIPLHQFLEGPLDRSALETAFAHLVERHESLRTTFVTVEGEPRQMVHSRLHVPIEFRNIGGSEHPEDIARQLGREEASKPFDLVSGPLLRACLLKLAEDRYMLLFTIHHIIADGVSLGVLARDLSRLYESARSDWPDDLPELAIGYPAYAAWQNQLLNSEFMLAHRRYWHDKLAGELPILNLPTDYPRPPLQSFRGRELSFTVAPERLEALRGFCQERNASLFMALHATLKVLLFLYTAQEDIVIGCAVAGREEADLADQIGFYLNILPLRSSIRGDAPFDEFFGEVVQLTKESLDHQIYPFDQLVGDLNIARDPSRFPLFDVMLVLQNQDEPRLRLDGIRARPVFEHPGTSKFDLTFCFKAVPAGLILAIEYNTDLFSEARVRRMGGHFLELIDSILGHPGEAVGRLNLLPDAERRRLRSFSPRTPGRRQGATLVVRFEDHAARAPDRIALVWPGGLGTEQPVAGGPTTMSYGELNRRANRLAHQLQRMGVGPDVLVGVYLEPSLDTVVAIIGILKAGGAYVPLDTSHPTQRLAFMLDDAGTRALITQRHLAGKLPRMQGHVVCLDRDTDSLAAESDRNLARQAGPDDLAYVIYTSGSAGRPKGVRVSNANIARLFYATDPWFDFGADDVWILFHSCAFDFSVWEMWGALIYGGRLVVSPFWTTRSPQKFYELLADERVTVLNQTPSAFQQLVQWEEQAGARRPLALRLVIFGGEALHFGMLKPWFERHGDSRPRLVNMYGITETTVHATYRPVTADDVQESSSLIGRPIPDLGIHLLNPLMQPVPIGVPGEIYLSGAGVAQGYLNRPELTAERFVRNPFGDQPDGLLYRSGDLGRYREDGDIEYLGRIDQQHQIRGYRVEVGEIEAALAAHPGVQQAVVDVRADLAGDLRVVTWYISADGHDLSTADMRDDLRGKLPDYMVPAVFVRVPNIVLTSNGKVDRKRLPEPDREFGRTLAFESPRTEWEQRLARLWAEVLSVPRVGVHENFFQLGGHSLKATAFIARLQRETGVHLTLVDVFRHPSVAALAAHCMESCNRDSPKFGPAASTFPTGQAGGHGVRPATDEELEMLD
jgi:amino acid adenylation domain-containing protein